MVFGCFSHRGLGRKIAAPHRIIIHYVTASAGLVLTLVPSDCRKQLSSNCLHNLAHGATAMTESSHLLLFVVDIDLSRIIPRLHMRPPILKTRACPIPQRLVGRVFGAWRGMSQPVSCFCLGLRAAPSRRSLIRASAQSTAPKWGPCVAEGHQPAVLDE